MAVFKLVTNRLPYPEPEFIEQRVFVGPDRDRLQLAGTLRLRPGEKQEFGAALLLGIDVMRKVRGPEWAALHEVIIENEDERG